ncbi:LysR family transcriptional regulator [Clostridium sp. AM33-3]|uniref:LysR family transcriptional regulator n=1 Tax=Clostridium sp. AM33-3 TaxID=2292304 RepID=UPI000E517BDD|nr:LysR family transcriptional regulator [Clostridium sp. AM33-3]RHT21298.1 LysR family transcriptional regulator [Clostridium sp. AM33-3]
MEFREISTFLQVAQYQSFSKAARHLGYSQAAVTIQIKQLEQELGVHLFDRIGKQISLTHQGQVFYQYAVSIRNELEQAKNAVSDPSTLSGKLCLGTIESICASIFPDLLAEYHRLHPEVTISIVTDSPGVLLDRMNENTIDIVYLLDRRIYDNRWCKTLEEPEENIFVASPDHELALVKRELELDEVLRFPFFLTEKDASYRHMLEQYLASINRSVKPFLEIGNTEFIIHMLLKNTGISFLPKFTVQRELQQKQLTALNVRGFQMQTWRQIFYHKNKWVTREMQEFLRLADKMS